MRAWRLALAVALMGAGAACSDEDPPAPTTSTSSATTAPAATGTTVADDPALVALLLRAEDLPGTFASTVEVDDTITAFCAGQDAAAGLQASGRAVIGFSRTPPGASVIQLAFRFEGGGAPQFVTQAEGLLAGCSDVPDATGLAFTYEPVSTDVAAALGGGDSSASRYGVSVGSGDLTVNVAVVQRGDLGALIAVLGLDLPRTELDALAGQAFTAATARLG